LSDAATLPPLSVPAHPVTDLARAQGPKLSLWCSSSRQVLAGRLPGSDRAIERPQDQAIGVRFDPLRHHLYAQRSTEIDDGLDESLIFHGPGQIANEVLVDLDLADSAVVALQMGWLPFSPNGIAMCQVDVV
jgi:hypothetical protein